MNHPSFRRPPPPLSFKAQQTGFSLVELIVSMVIGLTVVGAALAMYVSSGSSGRGSSALSQMTEDASIALSLLRSQVAMAGYGNPTSVDAAGVLHKDYDGQAIFGCTGGATTATATSALLSLVCNNDSSKPDSIVVLYQADTRNTVPNSSSVPTDCVGSGVTAVSPGVYVTENRYFVNGTTLSCVGKRSGTPLDPNPSSQPLVENIKDLKISYGVAGLTGSKSSNVAERYLTAQQINGATVPSANAALWNQVTSARICILVRSETPVLDKPAPYYDCSGSLITPADDSTDKFLYRAFTTTVVLQNRLN